MFFNPKAKVEYLTSFMPLRISSIFQNEKTAYIEKAYNVTAASLQVLMNSLLIFLWVQRFKFNDSLA